MSQKILLITQNYFPEIGSAANRMKNFYETLSEDNEVDVITTIPVYPDTRLYIDKQQNSSENITQVNIKIKKYEKNLFFRFLLYIEVLAKILMVILKRKGTYDKVFVSSPPVFIILAGIVAKIKWKADLIMDIRDLWPDSFLGVEKFTNSFLLKLSFKLEKKLYRSADKIIINSQGFESYLIKKGVSKEKLIFIPNSLTKTDLAIKKKEKSSLFTIIYTGNVGLAQDFDIFLEVAEKLKMDDQIRFVVIGYGYRIEYLEKKIKEKELENTVEILPPTSRGSVLNEVKQADLAFLSLKNHQIFESVLPGKLIDYLGCGIPIIGVLSGYSRAVLKESKAGQAFNNQDVAGVIDFIKKMKDHDEIRQKMSTSGLKYAKKYFSWEENKHKLKELFH